MSQTRFVNVHQKFDVAGWSRDVIREVEFIQNETGLTQQEISVMLLGLEPHGVARVKAVMRGTHTCCETSEYHCYSLSFIFNISNSLGLDVRKYIEFTDITS